MTSLHNKIVKSYNDRTFHGTIYKSLLPLQNFKNYTLVAKFGNLKNIQDAI